MPAEGFTPVTTEEGRLQQLVEYFEQHVSSYRFLAKPVPWQGTADEVASARRDANVAAARIPDATVHAAMLVLGAAVNHNSPYIAYAGGSVEMREAHIAGVSVRVFIPGAPTGAVVIGAHGGSWWMGNGECRDLSFSPDAAALSARSGAIVIDVDYRLAPENPMPAAVEDVVAVAKVVLAATGCEAVGKSGQLVHLEAGATEHSYRDEFRREILGDELGDSIPQLVGPVIMWGVSSGGHVVTLAAKQLAEEFAGPVALLLNAPALDLRGLSAEMLAGVYGSPAIDVDQVSPAAWDETLLADLQPLRVHVQENVHDGVVLSVDSFLANVRAGGGNATKSEFMATHVVTAPAVQRERTTDAARFILAVTGTERDLPDDPAGEYDKEAVDEQNRIFWNM